MNKIFINHLVVGFQVVVQDVDGNGQVAGVVRVDPVPALRTELSSLAHHRVEVAQREQNRFELLLSGAHFQSVLLGK